MENRTAVQQNGELFGSERRKERSPFGGGSAGIYVAGINPSIAERVRQLSNVMYVHAEHQCGLPIGCPALISPHVVCVPTELLTGLIQPCLNDQFINSRGIYNMR